MSLSTNGWDLVYKMRLETTNDTLRKNDTFTNFSTLKNKLASLIARGYSNKLEARLIRGGLN